MDISWHQYEPGPDSTVIGDLRVSDPVPSDRLGVSRELTVALPPDYDDPANSDRTYPVVLMHDGQNLFDDPVSYTGKWNADGALAELATEHDLPALIIGARTTPSSDSPNTPPGPATRPTGTSATPSTGRPTNTSRGS